MRSHIINIFKGGIMKKTLLIIGIVLTVLGVLSLMYAALNLFVYYNALDGSASLYSRAHQRMIIFFVIGSILVTAGIICIVARSRIN